jgi:uncharacterized protein YkwD
MEAASMTRRTTAVSLWLVALTLTGALMAPAAHASAASYSERAVAPRHRSGPNYAWQMYVATNASRRRMGLPPLVRDKAASRVALAHCRAMVRAHNLYHSTTISPYLAGVGRFSMWGENIGWTTGGVPDLERAFMTSPDHRTHILSRSFRHVAVGALKHGHRLWVTLFFYG